MVLDNKGNLWSLLLTEKDKLLRNDYPKFDRSVRPMSDAESQEKMILWKLRCSATKQLSSPTGFEKSITTNGQGTAIIEIFKVKGLFIMIY